VAARDDLDAELARERAAARDAQARVADLERKVAARDRRAREISGLRVVIGLLLLGLLVGLWWITR
jgi:hypothetical protein